MSLCFIQATESAEGIRSEIALDVHGHDRNLRMDGSTCRPITASPSPGSELVDINARPLVRFGGQVAGATHTHLVPTTY